jgi:signal transduction histidine kinase
MREFSHPSSKEKTAVDINRIVERSLVICKNEWRSVARVELHLAEDIPPFPAHESDLNQVVLNLTVNAAHAIAEKTEEAGRIDVTTRSLPDSVSLTVRDNGCGIPESIIERIFDPFFTTKDVGKGSGQGLAICYDIVVNKHGGRIDVQSNPGEGTTFQILLPATEVAYSDEV